MKQYLLDTNAFWEVLDAWNKGNHSPKLPDDLWQQNQCTFFVAEITTMEIYSVLGKYLRGKNKEVQTCTRELENGVNCSNKWLQRAIKPISRSEGNEFIHLIRSILLNKNPYFNVSVIPTDSNILTNAITMLQMYSGINDLHSLDAIVAATGRSTGFTIITFDKKLKTVLKNAEINLY